MIPLVKPSPCPAFEKNILYCVLSGITTLSKTVESLMLASKIDCTFCVIAPRAVSPILAVAATVLSPSGPRNNKSPANSWIVSLFTHPISLVTGCIAKSLRVDPVILNILFSQNINKESLNTFSPTMLSSTLIVPAPSAD